MDARYPGAFGDLVREASLVTHIAIVGPMGVGKSTLGRALAAEFGRPHHDSDEDLSARHATTGAEYAAAHGNEALWALEAELLIGRLDEPRQSFISAAGSVVENAACRAALAERALVVWLDAAPELVVARSTHESHRRPITLEEATELGDRRRPSWEALADLRVDASQSPAAVLDAARRFVIG